MAEASGRVELGSVLRLSGQRVFQEKLRWDQPEKYPELADAFSDAWKVWSSFVLNPSHKKYRKR